jgi:hypothetical protein
MHRSRCRRQYYHQKPKNRDSQIKNHRSTAFASTRFPLLPARPVFAWHQHGRGTNTFCFDANKSAEPVKQCVWLAMTALRPRCPPRGVAAAGRANIPTDKRGAPRVKAAEECRREIFGSSRATLRRNGSRYPHRVKGAVHFVARPPPVPVPPVKQGCNRHRRYAAPHRPRCPPCGSCTPALASCTSGISVRRRGQGLSSGTE